MTIARIKPFFISLYKQDSKKSIGHKDDSHTFAAKLRFLENLCTQFKNIFYILHFKPYLCTFF